MTEKKKSFLSSFEIVDRDSCEKAIKNGGYATLISAAITAVFGILGFFVESSDHDLSYMLDPWILADVVLMVILAFFIFRKSRVAATLLLIYFIASKVLMWVEMGSPKGILVSIIFFLYYLTAMRGTYLWHTKYVAEPAPI
ncbi:MAG: hypothetical protein E6K53_10810 [Gammaproteobacteria bacterium]|nr:MAG: hypothetical protein E6K53_10810 [Gammaproteobacteria bacterium]